MVHLLDDRDPKRYREYGTLSLLVEAERNTGAALTMYTVLVPRTLTLVAVAVYHQNTETQRRWCSDRERTLDAEGPLFERFFGPGSAEERTKFDKHTSYDHWVDWGV